MAASDRTANHAAERLAVAQMGRRYTGAVCFGNKVKIVNLDTDQVQVFKLVGERESDVKNEKLSYKSPLGRELLGKKAGDDIELVTPSGERFFEILEVFSY